IGPLTMSLMPQCSSAGTRRVAASTCGTRRSRSPGKRLRPNHSGTPSAKRARAPLSGRGALDADGLGVLVDLGAGVARALAQRHREIGGGDVAVLGVVEG